MNIFIIYLKFIFYFLLISQNSAKLVERKKCEKRYFHLSSFVCVCNSTYCDTIEPLDESPVDQDVYQEYTTNRVSKRLDKLKKPFSNKPQENSVQIEINESITYQKIKGFGGALTDSTGYNLFLLSENTSQHLLESYFGKNGLEYNILRIPIGGTDFSLRKYSYLDDQINDFTLSHFNLSIEDYEWKIPLVNKISKMSARNLSLFASAWSAPAWMKTNNDLIGRGTLKGRMGGVFYQTWADYYLKFFQDYKKHGINFWAVTSQNEPTDGYYARFPFNCMAFTPQSQAVFITDNLAPTLKQNGFDNLKIMILDDQRSYLPGWAQLVFKHSPRTKNYVDGIAVHWYFDRVSSPAHLDLTHFLFPDKWLFLSEASNGFLRLARNVMLGSFERAELYAKDVIENLMHWVTGWTDWNLALDLNGGPNWARNFLDAPVLINQLGSDEFYKQPMFYILGHFSKFINEESVRLNAELGNGSLVSSKLFYVAVYNPVIMKKVLVVLNCGDVGFNVSVRDTSMREKFINFRAEQHSIRTIIW